MSEADRYDVAIIDGTSNFQKLPVNGETLLHEKAVSEEEFGAGEAVPVGKLTVHTTQLFVYFLGPEKN